MWDLDKIGFWVGLIGGILALFAFFGISDYTKFLELLIERKAIIGVFILLASFLWWWRRKKAVETSENIDFSRLPRPSAELIGRETELVQLTEALRTQKHLAYIYAVGGIGKSALIFKWLYLIQPDYRGAKKVFAWSFYSQGSHDTQNSSVPFFQTALPFFGYSGELPKEDIEKGRALAKCLKNQRFILILDGLEPLQHPTHILDGELKDKAIQALLDEIHYDGLTQSPSLVVVSSRQPLQELKSWKSERYLTIELQTLSDEVGMKLLKSLKVIGTDEELKRATQEMGGHALALVLLGKMLVTRFGGDIARRDQLSMVQTADEKLYRHVDRILRWYADFYAKNNTTEAIFLNLFSLFDRPMRSAEKEELVKKAECAAPLRDLNQVEWQQLEKSLENAGLLLHHEGMRTEWDCHPLIRSYFAKQFKATRLNLFRQAHLVLFEYYQQVPKKQQPDTLEELEPLYSAVVHGCLAGEYKKALNVVYWERIKRGEEYYSTQKLGAYSQDLTALAAFFPPDGWSQPVQQGLSEVDQARLLATVSFCLMSLGRLTEAVEPRKIHLRLSAKIKNWNETSIAAQNLVDLLLPLGRLEEAATAATQAIDYATQKSANLSQQMASHAYRATVLHRQGQSAREAFEKAEQLQQQWQPAYPQLYSLPGFQYCAWLLDQPHVDLSQVVARGEYSLKIVKNPLSISLDQLTLARAYRQLGETTQTTDYFEKAVAGIRKAGKGNHLAYFLIDRANFYLDQQQFAEALRDLAEAWLIIKRSDMKLYAVDYHLAMRRAEPEKAQFHETEAKKLIAATGYYLRKV